MIKSSFFFPGINFYDTLISSVSLTLFVSFWCASLHFQLRDQNFLIYLVFFFHYFYDHLMHVLFTTTTKGKFGVVSGKDRRCVIVVYSSLSTKQIMMFCNFLCVCLCVCVCVLKMMKKKSFLSCYQKMGTKDINIFDCV